MKHPIADRQVCLVNDAQLQTTANKITCDVMD